MIFDLLFHERSSYTLQDTTISQYSYKLKIHKTQCVQLESEKVALGIPAEVLVF